MCGDSQGDRNIARLKLQELQVTDIAYTGPVGYRTSGQLSAFSHTFTFGKAYMLVGAGDFDSWIISLLIAGKLTPNTGDIHIDDVAVSPTQLRKISWVIRGDAIKRWGFLKQSVISQIRAGINDSVDVERIVDVFRLHPNRYIRKMSQLSHEAWRASCAIGYAHGKRIFCFPDMAYLRPGFVEEYGALWLGDMIRFLKASNAIVLMPYTSTPLASELFDEVVELRNTP
jgi:hypothetical protein